MISALTGELRQVGDDRIYVQVGPLLYEMLVPAADLLPLTPEIGKERTFHTMFYIEGDASGGNLEPRLIGFLRPEDKAFFQLFITVKGIGPRKALKALMLPVGQIAQAIESKNARFLVELPQIGKRMAELIVAELSGKCAKFAAGPIGKTSAGVPVAARSGVEEDAIAALMALGERRTDAETLLDRAKQSAAAKSTDALVREMLRLRTSRG